MASQEQPPPLPLPPLPPPPQDFPLHRLPPEIRDNIWTFTLPDRRIFDASTVSKEGPEGPSFLDFHFRHPPPATLQICRESRAAALRRGFFFKAGNESPGVWFKPETDMFYITQYQYGRMIADGCHHIDVKGLDKTLHVGVELSTFLIIFFRGLSRERFGRHLQEFYTRMPSLESLGGVSLRRSVP
ncbi:hypothetical protein FLAG1_06264 [Fusarium langsethiae]|uniref:2EXR domain-containing protein n=1 Tax=Fusarium langsethiae TaxID=179993 RepID=A0A0M9EVP0_FUSLA|nr:hypothetical protein FLAG1_06264 [Fusarium langsethiae]GKU03677.1 unnamed protein product [Fusarium langsethiae]GKU21045.1 unnamed protein product [Fusarium langsethiae]